MSEATPQDSRPSVLSHTWTVLNKNLLLKRRAWRGTLLELILPSIFLFALIPAKIASGDTKSGNIQYAGEVTDLAASGAALKCKLNNDADTRLSDVPDCVEEMDSAQCLGNLCIMLPLDNADELRTRMSSFLNAKAASPPDYDTVALIRWFALSTDLPDISTSGYFFSLNPSNSLNTGHRVAVVAPGSGGSSEQQELAASFDQFLLEKHYTHQFTRVTFSSEKAAIDSAKSEGGSRTMWAVVVISSQLDYAIRMNNTAVPDTKVTNGASQGKDLSGLTYVTSGFITLQRDLTEWIAAAYGFDTISLSSGSYIPMPVQAYTKNSFLSSAGSFLPMILAFAFLYPVTQMVTAIVKEKEARIREGMLVMGLSSTAFQLSWMITGFVQMTLTSVLMTLAFSLGFVPNTSGLLVFFVFWFYCISLMAFSLLVSVFFSKAQLAAMVTPLLFLGTVIPSIALSDPSDSIKKGLSIISNSAFSNAIQLFADAESDSQSITFSNASDGSYSIGTVVVFLVFDIVAYLLLALYFDQVLPSEWGAKKPFYFIFVPSLWFKSGRERIDPDAVDGATHRDLLEAVTDPMIKNKERVSIVNLRKEFNEDGIKKVAVNNMNMQLYEGQLQVLLGHNGAGKTTLINMLTGMLPVTTGTASIYGNSVTTQLSNVRQDIGLCPQHNILWDHMTCAEHLRFFAKLKGVPAGEIEDDVDEMLKKVDLADSKNSYSADLSGGMKRKLSVGIALIGGSRFVIFDEPTAGMDVQARRCIWDLLKESRHNRTVLLTTHFMDEADLLGDNIAIMHNGKMYCAGSSLFLKSRLGVGYNLKIDFANQGQLPSSVTSLITDTVAPAKTALASENVELLSSAGTELSYRIPMWAVPRFADLFEQLETKGKGLGVSSFGISVTTLEEIFIKIAHDSDDSIETPKPTEKTDSKTRILKQTAVPAYTEVDISKADDPERAAFTRDEMLTGSSFAKSQFVGLMKKRFRYMKRDKCALCVQLIMPMVMVMFAIILSGLPVANPPSLSLVQPDKASLFTSNSQDLADDISSFTNFVPDTTTSASLADFDDYLLATFDRGTSPEERWVGSYAAADGSFSSFYNMTLLHSAAYSSTTSLTAQLRAAAPGTSGLVIQATNHPMPFSEYYKNTISGFQAVSVAIFILIPFTFIPGIYVAYAVKERESKAKHVQLVSGVQLRAYWGSFFLWDFLTFMYLLVHVIVILAINGKSEFVKFGETLFSFFLLFTSYTLTAQASSYLASFYFKSHTKAQNTVMLASFLSGFILVITVSIFKAIDATKDAGNALSWIFRLVPAFCLGHGITELSTLPSLKSMGQSKSSPLSFDVTGADIIYMVLMFPVYVGLLLLHEKPELMYTLGLKKQPPSEQEAFGSVAMCAVPKEDVDVAAERRAVEGVGGRAGDVVLVQHLRKVFPPSGSNTTPKVAVKDVTFGVKSNEIFAFLGTNGAGKTTTLSILSGEILPTAGKAFINNHDVVTDPAMARKELGYCPQFDALLDLLTPREHLELYASLRGVPVDKREAVIEYLITVFDLTAHQNKRCKSLSGGNKRKTSIAMSLIGNPSCVLLDEPTAGMDPVARRGLWTALQKIGDGRCVVLTTHHLEEVEALAHRTAIMVAGTLKCLGTLTHLRNKFGGAYEVEVKTSPAMLHSTKQFFNERIGAQLIEETNCRLTYKVSLAKLTLSKMFRLISDAKEDLEISDFSINQTSLEQVFMAICKKQFEQTSDVCSTAASSFTHTSPLMGSVNSSRKCEQKQ